MYIKGVAEQIKKLGTLALVSIIMGIMPLGSEPHLWQKLKLLINGWLSGPMDIFDLMLHGLPLVATLGYAMYIFVLFLQRRVK